MFQVSLYRAMRQIQNRIEMDKVPNQRAGDRRHRVVRVVHTGVDIRVQRHAVLRGHTSGRKPATEKVALLDQSGFLHHIRDRNVF